jgi:hypothetical protein
MGKWWNAIVSASFVVILAIAGIGLFGAAEAVSAADLQAMTESSVSPGLLGDGYLAHGRGWMGGESIDYSALLAEALDITVDELQNAYEAARVAAIKQAVDEGLLTQERADEMQVWGGFAMRGLDRFGRAPRGFDGSSIDEQSLLADALGITVDDLQAARERANEAAVAQAIEEGLITQEQAAEMQARRSLMSYLDRGALLAQALGVSEEDVESATLSDLIAQQGLDAATVRENLAAAYADALDQAVQDGVITQEQADDMQAAGFGGFRYAMPGGRGTMPRGHGRGCQDHSRLAPNADDVSDSSGTSWWSPRRSTVQGDDTL